MKALLGAGAALIVAFAAPMLRAHTVEEWERVLALGTLEIATQRDVADAVTLSVEIVESETAEPTAAMIRLLDERGRLWIPNQAVPIALGGYRYAERLSSAPPRAGARTAPDYAILGEFTCSGRFEIDLPPGTYTLRIRKGREYHSHRETIVLEPGQAQRRTVVLTRWLDMPKQGWYSGDGHLHYARPSRAANPRLMKWIQAEDLHVANVLQMEDARRSYFRQYAFGKAGRHRDGDYVLVPGEETSRSAFFGHLTALNTRRKLLSRERYYLYPDMIAQIRRQGGIPVFDHVALLTLAGGSARMIALAGHGGNVTLGQVTVGLLLSWAPYYRWLDLGMRFDLSAGSDAPWNLGSMAPDAHRDYRGIGHHRVYVQTGREFDTDRWFEGLERGHTFVSFGDFPLLEVNGELPGSEIRVKKGETVRVRALVHTSPENEQPSSAEILVSGEVRWRATQSQRGEPIQVGGELKVEHSVWIVCRSTYGHTSPVYVRVGDEPWWNRDRFPGLVRRQLQLLDQIAERERIGPGAKESAEDEALFQAQRPQLLKHVEGARKFYRELEIRFRGTTKQ